MQDHNEQLRDKLQTEINKFDELQDEVLELNKKLELTTADFDLMKLLLNEQDKNSDEFKKGIEEKTEITEDLKARIIEEEKIQKEEDDKNRRLAQDNAALRAKLEFVQNKYDFTENVNKLSLDDFRTITVTNNMVNESIHGFMEKLNVIKEETTRMEAAKMAF